MAKPIQLQWLRHGKILCKAVYPFFVETWNWLVNSWNNLIGDFDSDPKNGAIWVDKSDPDHPVIRLRTDNLNFGKDSEPGCFEMKIESSDGTSSMTFYNQYYNIAGKTYEANISSATGVTGIVSLVLDISSSVPSASMEVYDSISELQEEQKDKNKYIIPLYTIANGAITCDWRKGANAAMWEF